MQTRTRFSIAADREFELIHFITVQAASMTPSHSVWIEAEHWAPGEWTPRDTNSDVLVTLADGSRWAATFFAYDNIATLRAKNALTGECLGGRYSWSTNMILIDVVTRERIELVIDDLLRNGEFQSAFDGPVDPPAV